MPRPGLPKKIETQDRALIYDPNRDDWYEALLTAYRPPGKYAKIDIATTETHTIIAGKEGATIKIMAIFFTTEDEVDITLYDGATAMSGAMSFGASGEPKGAVMTFPYTPLELSEGSSFLLGLDSDVQVSGLVCYYST